MKVILGMQELRKHDKAAAEKVAQTSGWDGLIAAMPHVLRLQASVTSQESLSWTNALLAAASRWLGELIILMSTRQY